MPGYDDRVGLCGLTLEEIETITSHERVPKGVAQAMQPCLCSTPEGKRVIRHVILADIEEAREHGNTQRVAVLARLHHFVVTHLRRASRSDVSRHIALTGEATTTPDVVLSCTTTEQRIHALGFDAAAARWVRRRVEAYLTAMLRHFGLGQADLRERYRLELLTAETRCAACRETDRCRRFLAGAAGSEAPSAFCPNAELFEELRRRDPPRRPADA